MGKGPGREDSLLSDDVLPWEGRTGHPSHLHMVRDLREVQAQVHTMDGHSSSSFWWSRHCQNLQEESGISQSGQASNAEGPCSTRVKYAEVLNFLDYLGS